MPTVTVQRANPIDPIYIKVIVFNQSSGEGKWYMGLFDTGNDHTVISQAVFDDLSLQSTGRPMPVHGVTGSSLGHTAIVTIGIKSDEDKNITISDQEVAVVSGSSESVLIGRDFLRNFDIAILCNGTFRMIC